MTAARLAGTEGVVGLAILVLLALALVVGQGHARAMERGVEADLPARPASVDFTAMQQQSATAGRRQGLRHFRVVPITAGLGVDLDLGGNAESGRAGGAVIEL